MLVLTHYPWEQGKQVGELGAGSGQVPWIREAVVAGRKYHIKTKSPLVHNAKNLALACSLLLASAVVAGVGRWLPGAYYWLIAPWAFGLLYFAFFILVVHEASHGMFLTLRNRLWAHRLNRLAGTIVAVFFATNYRKHWEVGHLAHHVRPLEPEDPQQHNTLVGRPLLWRVVACLLIPGFLLVERTLLRTRKSGGVSSSSRGTMVAFVLCWSVVLFLVTNYVSGRSAACMFLGIHVIVVLNHVKGSLEHGGLLAANDNPFLRSRSTFFRGRFLLMPLNITLHFEHHLNHRIPWYDLPRYTRDLRRIVPPEVAASVWNHRPLRQLAGQLPAIPEAKPYAAVQA